MDALTIVGAGGIGCAVGHALCAAGPHVTFVDADPEKVEWGRRHGVGIDGRRSYRASFKTFADWTAEPEGIVLLCTKCFDNAAVLKRLPPSVVLLPIQNGFDPLLEGRDGLEGIASFVSECRPHQTQTRITRRGRLHLGWRGHESSRAGPLRQLLTELAALLRRHAAFRVTVVSDILPYKYTKLMYNAAISPLAAAAGVDNGCLLSDPIVRDLFFDLLTENYTILHQAGVPLGKVGPFHPATVQRILAHRSVARALSWAFYPTLRGTYCSMSGDLPAGRTEIEFYNRHLIELAGDRPCPLNRRVYALVKRMESERRRPDLGILRELVA